MGSEPRNRRPLDQVPPQGEAGGKQEQHTPGTHKAKAQPKQNHQALTLDMKMTNTPPPQRSQHKQPGTGPPRPPHNTDPDKHDTLDPQVELIT